MGRRCRTYKAVVSDPPREMETGEVDRDWEEEAGEGGTVKGLFACYLLCSLSPRHKGHTYIGFTVNPQRRIKHDNGKKRCGAWRTKRGRPWELVLCIYGYPSNVSALQVAKTNEGYSEDHALECSVDQEEEDDEEYFYMPLYSQEPHMDGESSTSLSPHFATFNSSPAVEEVKELFCFTKPPERIRERRKASGLTPFSGIEDSSMKQLRQKSTPSNSEHKLIADGLLPSPEGDLINSYTPSSSILRIKTKRALFDSEIIDLTDSPHVIQL